MANILVLIPVKPTLPDALFSRCYALLHALDTREKEIGEHRLEVQLRACAGVDNGQPFSAHAHARNTMLDLYLDEAHTHVLWIDADLVEYPADLATRLHALDSDGVIAPTPLIEGTNRFYDVRGFIDSKGRCARTYPPYFTKGIPMQSVGTCYLAPAALYHAGARYEPTEGHTEHYSVCRQAARVNIAPNVLVWHADLPRWGEAYH